jgi:hypothetical protein
MATPTPSTNTNGNKLTYWIIGLLAPPLIGMTGAKVAELQANSARITVLESQVHNSEHRLQRIEEKLDRLMEKVK